MLFCKMIVSADCPHLAQIFLYIQTSGCVLYYMQVYKPQTILSVCVIHTADSGNILALSA